MQIGIVGLGLIGGSLGRAWTAQYKVFGADVEEAVLKKALLIRACDAPLSDETVGSIDLLVIAVNTETVESVLSAYLPRLKPGACVCDVSGNKRCVADVFAAAAGVRPDLYFIATHPMAGKETWGISYATPLLFKRASLLFMPLKSTLGVTANIKQVFLDAGFMHVKFTTPETHDRMIAYTSQLAHVLSGAYVQNPLAREHDGYSAGSFLDMTRVARANAGMWTNLFLQNRDNLLSAIDIFTESLNQYRAAIESGDAAALHALIESGNAYKTEIDKNTRLFKKNADA